jgi:hypothetical protein
VWCAWLEEPREEQGVGIWANHPDGIPPPAPHDFDVFAFPPPAGGALGPQPAGVGGEGRPAPRALFHSFLVHFLLQRKKDGEEGEHPFK